VLCFPFIFRGALDVGATTVNEAMKLATVRALADLAMAEPVQVTHCLVGGRLVVNVRAGHAETRAVLATVDDGGQLAFLHQGTDRLAHAVPEKNQAIGLTTQQHFSITFLTLRIVMGVTQHDRVAFPKRSLFDPLDDQREKRVCDIRHGDEQLARRQRTQALGGGVRGIPELVYSLQHAAPGGFRDLLRIAEHSRHCCRRDFGTRCDIVDGSHQYVRK